MRNTNMLRVVICAAALCLVWIGTPVSGARAQEGASEAGGRSGAHGDIVVSRDTLKRILEELNVIANRLEPTERQLAAQIREAREKAIQLDAVGRLDEAAKLILSGEYLTADEHIGSADTAVASMIETLIRMPDRAEGLSAVDLQKVVENLKDAATRQMELVKEAGRLGDLAAAKAISADIGQAIEREAKLAEQIPAGKTGKEAAEQAKEQSDIKAETEKVKEALEKMTEEMKAKKADSSAAQAAQENLKKAADNMARAAEELKKASDAQDGSPQQEQGKKDAQAAAEQAKSDLQKAKDSLQQSVDELQKKGGKPSDPKDDLNKLVAEQKKLQKDIEKIEEKSGKSPQIDEARKAAKEAADKFNEAQKAAQKAEESKRSGSKNAAEQKKMAEQQQEALKKGEEEAKKAEEALRKEKERLEEQLKTVEQLEAVKKTKEALADILKQQEDINAKTRDKGSMAKLLRPDFFDIIKLSERQGLLARKTKILADDVRLQEATVAMPWLLNQVSGDMLQVSTMLYHENNFEVGEPTQQRQAEVARDLRALIGALEEVHRELKEKKKEAEKKEDGKKGGGKKGGGGDQQGAKKGGAIPVAELKVLKHMEEKLHTQTVQFQADHPDAAKYTVTEVARIENLKKAQSEIKNLSEVLIKNAEEAIKAANEAAERAKKAAEAKEKEAAEAGGTQ